MEGDSISYHVCKDGLCTVSLRQESHEAHNCELNEDEFAVCSVSLGMTALQERRPGNRLHDKRALTRSGTWSRRQRPNKRPFIVSASARAVLTIEIDSNLR